jgi:hypothetical protein
MTTSLAPLLRIFYARAKKEASFIINTIKQRRNIRNAKEEGEFYSRTEGIPGLSFPVRKLSSERVRPLTRAIEPAAAKGTP